MNPASGSASCGSMTLSERSNQNSQDAKCERCGGPLVWKQAHPYPVLLNILFGGSFIAFILLFSRFQAQRIVIYGWSLFQLVLGIFLVRGRLQARRRVLHCLRCNASLG